MNIKDIFKFKEIVKTSEVDVKLKDLKPMEIASKSTDSFVIKNIVK